MIQRNAQEPDLLNVVDSLTALAGRGASTGDLRFENEKKKVGFISFSGWGPL